MKIDFGQVLKDFRTGEDMKFDKNGATVPFTLGIVCSEALLMPSTEADPVVRTQDHALAILAFGEQVSDLTTEQVARLKARVAATWPSTLVAGQACGFLNG